MSFPTNIFDPVEQFSQVMDFPSLYEKRMINDGTGKILYLAISMTPNDDPDSNTWAVWAMEYDGGGFLNRYRLPDDGVGFKYTFTDIATYFS